MLSLDAAKKTPKTMIIFEKVFFINKKKINPNTIYSTPFSLLISQRVNERLNALANGNDQIKLLSEMFIQA
jgi:hypothetical protein